MDKTRLKQIIKEAIQDQGDLGRRDLSYKSPQLQKVLDFIQNCEDEIDLAMIYAELKPKMDQTNPAHFKRTSRK